jgi:DNA-binding beta-propeller fold protein YncE
MRDRLSIAGLVTVEFTMIKIRHIAAALVLAPSLCGAMPLDLLATLSLAEPGGSDQFGVAVALDESGAYVGATNDQTANGRFGSVTQFSTSTGAIVRTIGNPESGISGFGSSLALDATGLLVGALTGGVSGTGTAHLFDKATGGFVRSFTDPTPKANDRFSSGIDLSGSVVVIGASGTDLAANEAGAAYRFERSGGAPTNTFEPVSPGFNDGYGTAVAIDGNRILIGNGGKGTVEVRDAATGGLLRTITGPTGSSFGIALAASGGRVLVGAPNVNGPGSAFLAGAAYLYDIETGTLLGTFLNPTPAFLDLFGRQVALSATQALIGAYFDDTGAQDSGSAYLFDLASGALIQTLVNPDPDANDQFGFSLALHGDMALIGALNAEGGSGRAYLYGSAAPVPLPPGLALIGAAVAVLGLLRRRAPAGL